MMAGTETDTGGFKGSEVEPKLSSHQDLEEVGVDCGGTRLDSVDGDGNGNVRNDLGGSYVFVGGAGDVNTCDPPSDENSNVESKSEVDLKVQFGGGVVGDEGNDQSSLLEEGNWVLSVTDSEEAVHGESIGEVVGNESIGVIENGEPDCVVKVEDQVDSESSPMEGDEESQTNAEAEIGEGGETAIKLPEAGELSDRIVGAVTENILVSAGDLRESKESKTAVLEVAGCELAKVEAEIKVDIGEGMSKEESEIKSIEESLESQIGIMGSVGCVFHELENDKNKFEKTKDSDSDIAGAVPLGNEIDAADCEGSMTVADKYNVSRDKELEECIDDSQRFNEMNVTPSDVASPKSAREIPIECTENISDDTDDGAAIDHETSGGVIVQGSGMVNLVDESSTDITTTSNPDSDEALRSEERGKCINRSRSAELVGNLPAKTCGSCLASPVAGTVSDQRPADAKCQCGLFQGHKAERVLQDIDSTLTTVTGTRPASDAKILEINLGERIHGCINSPELNGNPNYDQSNCIGLQVQSDGSFQFDSMGGTIAEGEVGNLVSPITESKSELKNENLVSEDVESVPLCITDCTESVIEIPNGLSSCPPNDARPQMKIEFGSIDSAELGSTSLGDHVLFKSQVSNGDTKCAYKKTIPNNLDQKTHTTNSVKSGSSADVSLKSDGQHPSAISSSDEPGKEATGAESEALSGSIVKGGSASSPEGSIGDSVDVQNLGGVSSKSDGQRPSDISSSHVPGKDATAPESKVLIGSVVNGGSSSSPEGSIDDSIDVQNLGAVAKTKPFHFLVKFPRFDEDKLREQIRDAQLLVEEKTIGREYIRNKIEMKRDNLQSLGDNFEASRSNERAARRLVKLKRQEIDSLQARINRVKNSIAVMDITDRIAQMEYIIEHETQPLKEEKQMLREINQLKKLRDQISSNVCSTEEAPHAFSQIEPMEMQLKTLKKELGVLKDQVSKAEEVVILLGKGYNDESKRLRELQAQFRAANDVRQHAYKHLLGLKNQLHEKSKHYWLYKNDAKAANDFVLNGDREALNRLCINQVESVMDLWNKDDEFRKDYVRCNMRSTARRLKTLDGRSLGPDEEALVIPSYVDKREDMQLSGPTRTTSPSLVTIRKQENSVQPVKSEPIDDTLLMEELKIQNSKTKTSLKLVPSSGLTIGYDNFEASDIKEEESDTKEEENLQTEKELELARKAEMLRKEEIALKLKEQRRQEEKAKAQEALERKKRNAEKAQVRAELRAQKEAEQKEKEREKRLRKKEKKNTDGASGDLGTDSTKDESKDTTVTKARKTSYYNKYYKPKATIPPALRNRGKRRLKQFMWWICAALIVLFLFLVGNGSAFTNLKPRRVDKIFGNRRTWQPTI